MKIVGSGRSGSVIHLRFSVPASVDVLWRDALFDADITTETCAVSFPDSTTVVNVFDVVGKETTKAHATQPVTLSVG